MVRILKLKMQMKKETIALKNTKRLIALLLGNWTNGAATTQYFSVYRSSLADPLTYVRFFGHVLGHSGYDHYMGNMLLLLLVGPGLEEKYGSGTMVWMIALTALGRDDFISRAVNLGVNYYMVKPFDFMMLAQRVYEAAGESLRAEAISAKMIKQQGGKTGGETLEERIANLFLTVGIPAHIKGYQYLREAVRMVMDNPELMGRITKELYPGIAHRFGTTSSKVERAIRHAIEVAWNRGRIDALDEAFGKNVCALDDKPTNGEFIALVADRLGAGKSA